MSYTPTPEEHSAKLHKTAQLIASCSGQLLQQTQYLQDTFQAEAEAQQQLVIRRKSLLRIVSKVRQSLDFGEICQTATNEVRRILAADRVAIYRFNADWSGDFLYESADAQWTSLVESQYRNPLISKNVSECSAKLLGKVYTADTHLQKTEGGEFSHGEVFRICPDIYEAGFSDCYIEVLESYQARSYAIVAIYIKQKLWGLLAAYQNSKPRDWQEADVQLLIHIAEQLGIALKQAEYVQTIEQQSDELRKTLAELKRSQTQLIQNEKMASLGQLVAGVAHEINNPVNFIHGNLSHLGEYADDLLELVRFCEQCDVNDAASLEALKHKIAAMDLNFILADLPKIIESMKLGTERIQKIVLSLRNFSRLDEAEIKTVDVHEGIESTLLILGRRTQARGQYPGVEVIRDYGNIPSIECYPAQLNQVFMNLLANALDAIEEAHEAGKFMLLPRAEEGSPKLWIRTRLANKTQIEIHIRDNGVGIAREDEGKIFDHFFTTKEVGHGTGLGLTISNQIITETHCGTLKLVSSSLPGTEFAIRLPVTLEGC